MNKIRLQFMLLLLSVIVMFAGVVAVDLLFFEEMTRLYRLQTGVATVMGKWNWMASQSVAVLSSNQPYADSYRDWQQAYQDFDKNWRHNVDELETLTGGDAELLDQISWVRAIMEIGTDQLKVLRPFSCKVFHLCPSCPIAVTGKTAVG
jgi:hypothetical protein